MKTNIHYEFHIAKEIREKYKLAEELFSLNGNVVFANIKAVREFVHKVNARLEAKNRITVGEANALGLLDEIIHYVIHTYDTRINFGAIGKALDFLRNALGKENVRKLLREFNETFPPSAVYQKGMDTEDYLERKSGEKSNCEITLEEMILLHLDNFNPAAKKFKLFFDENYLTGKEIYREAIVRLEKFFEGERRLGSELLDLFAFLRKPFIKYPNDLMKQLEYIERNWKFILGDEFSARILAGKDVFKEEALFFEIKGGGTPEFFPPRYKAGRKEGTYSENPDDFLEEEKFTPDTDWMPNVVLIAKNTFVWLDQLSKKYGKEIKRLDQIPDEELDALASANINALWLIGIWERSPASKKIKHLTGNIDAVASAYSLYDYTIAAELGGEEAYRNLDERAKARGIRLASDMVPNHTGIYSDWVLNHPDYFVQRKDVPFPSYSFTGPDLSEDNRIEIKIEDGYYSKSDAAVVFRWRDKTTGETRYIYHGNDGTNMPWNDTAQLDMIKAEVREAVIQKIFEVADKFSIIRFDAAMTLAKRHFKRLWYPEPGEGGDIPSRSEFAMSKKEFDKFFPKEFWREVVDRINAEKPNTLLLAEAFWLMEGYFVRTLGMHRVYNSAFMHMMMNEENKKYRELITNTLEFDPDILKRYVNFMSNPDEETAIKQFGKGDKYFGVCVMMTTLPGLPMFAHGQIEGFTEKYGMEYKRAYYDETPDEYLVGRHRKEIFPILRKRYLFSEVENFWLYDFENDLGSVNENVFVFTNKFGREKALVLYNNKYERAKGHVKNSTPKMIKKENGRLKRVNICEELEILPGVDYFYIAKEITSGQEWIFSGEKICSNGFEFLLDGFQYLVFTEFEEVYDSDGRYRRLAQYLQGEPTDSIREALILLDLEPIHLSFERIFEDNLFSRFVFEAVAQKPELSETEERLLNSILNYLNSVGDYLGKDFAQGRFEDFKNKLEAVIELNERLDKTEKDFNLVGVEHSLKISLQNNYKENLQLLLIHLLDDLIQELFGEKIKDALRLDSIIRRHLQSFGRNESEIYFDEILLNILKSDGNFEKLLSIDNINRNNSKFKRRILRGVFKEMTELLKTENVREFIALHEYKGIKYYSKENFEDLIDWLFTLSILNDICNLRNVSSRVNKQKRFEILLKAKYDLVKKLKEVSAIAEYKWENLLENLNKSS
jgi:glycosidase